MVSAHDSCVRTPLHDNKFSVMRLRWGQAGLVVGPNALLTQCTDHEVLHGVSRAVNFMVSCSRGHEHAPAATAHPLNVFRRRRARISRCFQQLYRRAICTSCREDAWRSGFRAAGDASGGPCWNRFSAPCCFAAWRQAACRWSSGLALRTMPGSCTPGASHRLIFPAHAADGLGAAWLPAAMPASSPNHGPRDMRGDSGPASHYEVPVEPVRTSYECLRSTVSPNAGSFKCLVLPCAWPAWLFLHVFVGGICRYFLVFLGKAQWLRTSHRRSPYYRACVVGIAAHHVRLRNIYRRHWQPVQPTPTFFPPHSSSSFPGFHSPPLFDL